MGPGAGIRKAWQVAMPASRGDADLHHAAAATADDGEGDTYQQYHGHVEEQRQCADEAGQRHGPVGA